LHGTRDLRRREALERLAHETDEPEQRRDRGLLRRILQDLPELLVAHALLERIDLGIGQPQRADDLREVRVRAGAHEELELLVALFVRVAPAAPRPVAATVERERRLRAVHGLARAAVAAAHVDAAEIARGALAQEELG